MKHKTSKIKIIVLILVILLLLLIGGWGVFSISLYRQTFDQRFESYAPLRLEVSDFDGLEATRYTFPSDKGQMLTGYLYSHGEDPRAILVIAHGFGGGGHNSYMDVADFFAAHGFAVFAYDATACDESEGDGLGGVPQGVADLDHAITFIEGELPDLPVVLWGHSWGGYSVCNVLNYHPEVKAVAECSGCCKASDMFEAGGLQQAGDVIYTMLPFSRAYERLRYGDYAAHTALDGFAASDAAVMVVHSEDDDVLPIQYGYDVYYAAYQNDPRFTFVRFTDRGHNMIYNDTTYVDEFNAAFDEWLTTLDYDYHAAENKDRFAADKADYINTHLDRARWSHSLDPALFDQFLAFYEANIG